MKSYDELLALITRRGVHTVFGDYGEGWFIEQNADELARFLVAMQELGVESVLEIGTGWRAGLARFLHDDMGWRVTTVDVHDYGHQFEGIEFVTGLGSVAGRFDLVIIDADHAYESVQRDDEMWRDHATKVVAFHDIAGLRDCEGVAQYWDEIAYRDGELLPYFHVIIADGEQRGGIGYYSIAEFEDYVANADVPQVEPMPDATPAVSAPPPRKPRAKSTTTRKPRTTKK